MIWFGKIFIKFCKSFITLIKLVSTRTCNSARVRHVTELVLVSVRHSGFFCYFSASFRQVIWLSSPVRQLKLSHLLAFRICWVFNLPFCSGAGKRAGQSGGRRVGCGGGGGVGSGHWGSAAGGLACLGQSGRACEGQFTGASSLKNYPEPKISYSKWQVSQKLPLSSIQIVWHAENFISILLC